MPDRLAKSTIKVSNDPAGTGVEHSYTFTEDVIVYQWQTALVTDANVANRQTRFTFEDSNGNVYATYVAGGTQAASLTRQYTARPGEIAPPAVSDTVFLIPIPAVGIFVPQGGKVKTVTTSIQATDNYGVLTLECGRF
jgi:hypothetical protein